MGDLYKEWLAWITKLVSAAGGSPALSLSLPHPPSFIGDAAQGAPPPPHPKKVPWIQGAWPLDMTLRVRHPRGKKEAAKKSLGLKKAPPCSLHQHEQTVYCLWRRCMGTIKSKLHVRKAPR